MSRSGPSDNSVLHLRIRQLERTVEEQGKQIQLMIEMMSLQTIMGAYEAFEKDRRRPKD